MDFLPNIPLAPFTSFKIGGPAALFCRAASVDDVRHAIERAREERLPVLILGGGSNIVVSDNGFKGLVIRLELRGLSFKEEGSVVLLTCAAEERWDDVVAYAVRNGWWGIENLSHIPGSAGAFAVQNVGAYGQEASQVIDSAKVYDTASDRITMLPSSGMKFDYRKSIFNSEERGRYVILEVTLRLNKLGVPNLGYPDLQKHFSNAPMAPTLPEIREAIIQIRDRKYTTPNKIPNVGSFFKNPILSPGAYEQLEQKAGQNFSKEALQKLQDYRTRLATEAGVKIPAAFLIDACGLKGLEQGGIKVNESQPLVLLNSTGTATAHDVLALVRRIRQAVYQKVGIELHPEPELIGFTAAELRHYFALIPGKTL